MTDQSIGQPLNADGTTNYDYLDMGEWWIHPPERSVHMRQGFVSDSRFGSGPVIKRTNRDVTQKWRAAGERIEAAGAAYRQSL